MEKIKPLIKYWVESEKGKDIMIVSIVILVGLGSFGLGRLSKNSQNAGIKIEYPNQMEDQEANVVQAASSASLLQNTKTEKTGVAKNFFASNRGSKYYGIGCSAGKTIKQENRIYFATREDAEREGYELSSSCR